MWEPTAHYERFLGL
jgi:endoglucanase